MRGHVRQRGRNWAIVIDQRDPHTGQRKRRWYSFKGTKREAQVECARRICEMQSGISVDPSRMTVAAFLARWINHMRTIVSPRTLEVYGETVARITPHIGAVPLLKLRPAEIAATYAAALERGRRTGDGGLSPRSVHMMHRLLVQSLKQAVKWQLLDRNPCDAVSPPRVERKQMKVLDRAPLRCRLSRSRNCVGIGSYRRRSCYGSASDSQMTAMSACNQIINLGRPAACPAFLVSSSKPPVCHASGCTICDTHMRPIY